MNALPGTQTTALPHESAIHRPPTDRELAAAAHQKSRVYLDRILEMRVHARAALRALEHGDTPAAKEHLGRALRQRL